MSNGEKEKNLRERERKRERGGRREINRKRKSGGEKTDKQKERRKKGLRSIDMTIAALGPKREIQTDSELKLERQTDR